jgi:hypothetical protein
MHVEWTTYGSPVGALTLVECEAGPLVVEFPHRATSVKWAVRLRSAIPELHIAQGPCRTTAAWLDDYFAASPRALPFPEHLKQWFDLSPAQVAVFKTLRRIPLSRGLRGRPGQETVAARPRASDGRGGAPLAVLTNPKSRMTLDYAARSQSLALVNRRRPAGP